MLINIKSLIHQFQLNAFLLINVPTLAIAQIQKGQDIDGNNYSQSGTSVSMPDVNTVAIGSIRASDTGLVRIYNWNGNIWNQIGLDILGESTDDYSGNSISMRDNLTIAIGAKENLTSKV